MNAESLVGLLMIIHKRLEGDDIQGAKDSVMSLIKQIEGGWGGE